MVSVMHELRAGYDRESLGPTLHPVRLVARKLGVLLAKRPDPPRPSPIELAMEASAGGSLEVLRVIQAMDDGGLSPSKNISSLGGGRGSDATWRWTRFLAGPGPEPDLRGGQLAETLPNLTLRGGALAVTSVRLESVARLTDGGNERRRRVCAAVSGVTFFGSDFEIGVQIHPDGEGMKFINSPREPDAALDPSDAKGVNAFLVHVQSTARGLGTGG